MINQFLKIIINMMIKLRTISKGMSKDTLEIPHNIFYLHLKDIILHTIDILRAPTHFFKCP